MTKVLIIEDETFIRENLIELLEDEEFEVLGAENGKIGVELARQNLPDLILCDVQMPEMDGYRVLETLKLMRETAIIPFIFLTARAERDDLRRGMNRGADDYLIKPCTQEELLEAIALRLGKKAAVAAEAIAPYEQELEQTKQQLYRLLYYDNLTQLPNRLSLRSRLEELLGTNEQQETANRQSIAFLCLGLDRFHRINDNLGHGQGDSLLQSVAKRLTSCLSDEDTISRIEGDRFAIILADPIQRQQVTRVAQKLLETVSQSFILKDRELFVTASIGIASYPRDGQTIEKLLQTAVRAMDRAKQLGGNQYQWYTAALHVGSSGILELEASLRYALERQELEVYYQPQITLADSKVVGAEALLRWQHPERGLVSPAKFIPLAEETGLIVPIGEWVLQTACQQIKDWQALGYSNLRIAVNLSGRQFVQPSLRQTLVTILQERSFDPEFLELELTESIVVQNPESAIVTMKAMKALGVKIALDDFGTGYSSLQYLQRFPFDSLKIDRCFVQNLTVDKTNTALTTAIVEMAHQLNLKVIAEGVETKVERDFLFQHSCDEMQGYLFSPPLPANEFQKLLESGRTLSI